MKSRRLKSMDHWGKTVLILDFSHASRKDAYELMEISAKKIRSAPPRSVLTLSDVSRLSFDSPVIAAFKDFTSLNKPHVKAAAVVGLRGLQKIVFNTISAFSNRTFGVFAERSAALDWLTRQ
jgi:hypothetical protein